MNRQIIKDLKFNWHPYTQMKDHESFPPILIKNAEGIKLFDDKGSWYYDTISSWWCNIHGHRHQHITKAINEQLKKIDHVMFAGFTHEQAIRLSERLIDLSPDNIKRVFYSDNGSTAVETALKMSLQYWKNIGVKGRTKFVSLDMAYHGDTVGTMSISGVDLFNNPFKHVLFKGLKVPSPYCYRCPMKMKEVQGTGDSLKDRKCKIECIKPLEALLNKEHKNIAAFIIEPMILAAAGMIVYPKEYLKKAFDLCKRYNVHFIADEVAVGFGRTGKMFAFEHAGIKPDFVCLSKGLTNGTIPLAATLTTEKVYKAFYAEFKQRKTFYHGHTYTANPIGCAIANASLDIFKKDSSMKNALLIERELKKWMGRFASLPHIGDVRQIGTVIAFEIVKDKATKEMFPFEKRAGYKIYQKALKEHLILRPIGNVIYLYLPLSIDIRSLKEVLMRTFSVLHKGIT